MVASKRADLREVAVSEAVKVDAEAGIIRDVKIISPVSKNGRTYSVRALEQACKLYSGATVNLNHRDRTGRNVEEGFGVISRPRVQGDGVYGDLEYLKSHPMAAVIVERAQRFPNTFGLSHDAVGEVTAGKNGDEVTSIFEVVSVDLVNSPATVRGLFESEERKGKPRMSTVLEWFRKASVKLLPGKSHLKEIEKLSEMEGPMDAPMEVVDGASSDEQIKSAFRSMIMAAVDDEGLDIQATLNKIKEILKTQEKLLGIGEKKPDAAAGDGEKMPESIQAALDALKSQMAEVLKEKQAAGKNANVREAIENSGYTLADFTERQLELIGRQTDIESMQEMAEELAESRAAKNTQRQKPAVETAATSWGVSPGQTGEKLAGKELQEAISKAFK